MSDDLIDSTDESLVYLISFNSDPKQCFVGSAANCLNWAQESHSYSGSNLNRLQLDPNFLFGPAHLLVNLFVNPQKYFEEFKRSIYWKNAVMQGEYVGNERYEEVASWVKEFVSLPMNILLRVDDAIGKKMVLELYNMNMMSKDQATAVYNRLNAGDFSEYKFTEDGSIRRVTRTYKSGIAEA